MFCSNRRNSGKAALYPYIHICNLRDPLTLMLCVDSGRTKSLSIWLASSWVHHNFGVLSSASWQQNSTTDQVSGSQKPKTKKLQYHRTAECAAARV